MAAGALGYHKKIKNCSQSPKMQKYRILPYFVIIGPLTPIGQGREYCFFADLRSILGLPRVPHGRIWTSKCVPPAPGGLPEPQDVPRWHLSVP